MDASPSRTGHGDPAVLLVSEIGANPEPCPQHHLRKKTDPLASLTKRVLATPASAHA